MKTAPFLQKHNGLSIRDVAILFHLRNRLLVLWQGTFQQQYTVALSTLDLFFKDVHQKILFNLTYKPLL